MLFLQKFIKQHSDWQERLTQDPYNLKISEKNGFYLFKYSQLNSDFHKQVCREARGIILDSHDDWKVVRLAFYKFFNYGEQFADKIDWNSAVATEKIDGSIMTLWFARGEWHLSTNGSIDAADAQVNVSKYNFKELFDIAAKNCGLDYSKLNPAHNYTFELVSPYNRVVICYKEPAIYHLSTRDMTTLEEINEDIGVQKPHEYRCVNLESYQAIVAQMEWGDHEGIVIRDKHYRRVKMKTTFYFEMHHNLNNHVITLERALNLIRANDYEEFLVYFPEYKAYFAAIYERYASFLSACDNLDQKVQHWISDHLDEYITSKDKKKEVHEKFRGLFAQFVKKYINPSYHFIAFASYDYKLKETIDALPTAKIIEMTKMKDTIKLEDLINYENN
jgi:hypothetical protein